MYAVGNGHYNQSAIGKMARLGMHAGVADLCVPARRGPYSGLYLELKSARGSLSDNQRKFAEDVTVHGYQFEVAHSTEEAIFKISRYLFEYTDNSGPCACHPSRRAPREVLTEAAVHWAPIAP